MEDFQLIDNEPIDNSINKRDFLKLYHQEGANLNDSEQNVAFITGEKNNFHQTGNAYLEFDITVRNPAGNFDNISETRLIDNAFAYYFRDFSSDDWWLRPRR